MISRLIAAFVALILIFILISCSRTHSGPFPNSPSLLNEITVQADANPAGTDSHNLWGYFLVYVDANVSDAKIVPIRAAADHWNVLKFLEKGPCFNCLEVNGITPTPDGTILFDVEITHPFASANLTGFDVRGIAMFHGTTVFPDAELTVPDRTAGDGALVNPDGYTSLYNSTTAGSGPGGLQGYLKGKYASVTLPDASLNGYKPFISPGAANTRNAFYSDSSIVVTYELDMPDPPFVFGYAIDASWAPPTIKPVTDPMTDFPPEANCQEPWRVDVAVEPVGLGLTDQGGEVTITIDVYDRQGAASHHEPVVECPQLFDGTQTASMVQDLGDHSVWEVTVSNENLPDLGNYRCLVKVVDNEDLPAPAWLDLTAYQLIDLPVREAGWSRTWGGIANENIVDSAADTSGNVYVAGTFHDTVDFDPGPGLDEHTSLDSIDPFLCKYDSVGNYLWSRVWGGYLPDNVESIAIDSSNNLWLTGSFSGEAEFDSGPGEDKHTADGWDAYLTKYDLDGNYQWTQTWHGDTGNTEVGAGVAADSLGGVYVAGYFEETTDFDPGANAEERASNGSMDISLSKFDAAGTFQWVQTFGGIDVDMPYGVALISLSPCVTGYFSDTVDFDPGLGDQSRTSEGMEDVFVVQFDSSGNFKWADAWGGPMPDLGYDIVANSNTGAIYIAGSFGIEVDFDPGPVVENHTSIGGMDAFLSSLDSNGGLQWARTWGGLDSDYGSSVIVAPSGDLIVSGNFKADVDFDPGAGADNHTSLGGRDCFISSLDNSGTFNWARTWGGIEDDYCNTVAGTDTGSDFYAAGRFSDTVDMNPGPETDDHVSIGDFDAFLTKFLSSGLW